MSRIARITAGAVLVASALAAVPASAEFPPECKIRWHGGVPTIICTL